MFAEVAFPIRGFQTFTYSISVQHISSIVVGTRVSVPFRNKIIQGIVVKIKKNNSYSGIIKRIIEPVDKVQVITPPLWELINWVSKYYMTPIGKVANSVVPKSLSSNYKPQLKKYVKAKKKVNLEKVSKLKNTAPKQYLVFRIISEKNIIHKVSSFQKIVSNPLQICNSLKDKGLIKLIEKTKLPDFNESVFEPVFKDIVFNEDQKLVIDKIIVSLKKHNFNSFLLHGVTGSGKTEIYIEAVRYCLSQKRNAIILLPEISLTPQIAGRFSSVFGKKVAIWHSKMKSNERVWIWNQIRQGKISVVVGTRSAIFTPLPNVGLIIVDEEHDSSFKQENSSPKYNSRDLALVRAKYNNCIALLAGATPSMESYYNQKEKKLSLLEINKRYGKSKNPIINLVDMNLERKNNENRNPIFSQLLIDSIAEKIDKKEQVMLLQNRRGFSILNCNECQEVVMCGQCQIPLTFHKSKNLLICHYCSFKQKIYTKCSKCNNNLTFLGVGTQKIEEALIKLFPTVLIKRMDFDSTRKAGEHSKILDDFLKNKFHILLGTQMIAKGLDFPNVTLVGVINADMNLFIPDFRAGEKTFQLLYQVAGRTGRGEKPGKVVIQTNNPNDVSIFCASKLNLNKYYTTCLNERKELMYPPYSRITKIELSGKFEKTLISIGEKIANEIPGNLKWLEVIGPNPCPIFTLRGKKRYQIILKSSKKMDLNGRLLHDLIRKNLFDKINFYNKKNLQISIDVDPNNLL